MREHLGLIELFVVLLFAVGWGVIELVALRLDRERDRKGLRESGGGSASAPDEGSDA